MGFRFRRSIKIAPGVRWNFSKGGRSVSIGPSGAKVTLSATGTRVTTGLPGTGISHTQFIPRARPSEPQPAVKRWRILTLLGGFALLAWLLNRIVTAIAG